MPTVTREEKAGDMEEYLFRIVQRVTFTVKLFPFIYAFGLVLFWLIAPVLSATIVIEIDSLVLLSALMVLLLIRLSYCLKLCVWHRLQCALPLLPQVIAQIDKYVYTFGSYASAINYTTTAIIFILSLINAYFVFMKPMLIQWKRRRK